MNIDTFLKNKGYTVYRLSKETGISKTTLFDIFSGKSNILDCRVRIIMIIADALDCDIKELNENLKALISLLSSCEKGTGKVRVLSLNKEDKQ